VKNREEKTRIYTNPVDLKTTEFRNKYGKAITTAYLLGNAYINDKRISYEVNFIFPEFRTSKHVSKAMKYLSSSTITKTRSSITAMSIGNTKSNLLLI
jgi:hypothetical protein